MTKMQQLAPGRRVVELSRSSSLIQGLDSALNGVDLQANDRVRISVSCVDLAMEHQRAIVLLISNELFGSAFSILRLAFEAYVRGVWLHRCATLGEIRDFKGGRVPCFASLLSRIETIEGFEDAILSRIKKKSWKAMNDYTHSGYNQAVRRNIDNTIEPNYDEEAILEVLEFANAIGLLSALEVARLANDDKLSEVILKRSMEFWKIRP
jgi:hypothetical protein